jgi:hypothetical protein
MGFSDIVKISRVIVSRPAADKGGVSVAYDQGLAQLIRDERGDRPVAKRRMFGGLCFMVNGHMVAGVHPGGAMVRVGRPNEDAAFAIDGTAPMNLTGQPMTGMVAADDG